MQFTSKQCDEEVGRLLAEDCKKGIMRDITDDSEKSITKNITEESKKSIMEDISEVKQLLSKRGFFISKVLGEGCNCHSVSGAAHGSQKEDISRENAPVREGRSN